jgi:hypothetical protein
LWPLAAETAKKPEPAYTWSFLKKSFHEQALLWKTGTLGSNNLKVLEQPHLPRVNAAFLLP